jgi:hypothetical protein
MKMIIYKKNIGNMKLWNRHGKKDHAEKQGTEDSSILNTP